jgi:hypothetical protein
MNTACMIELKKEYTLLLCQVLTPIILEGLQHLYNESKKNSNKNNILKTFQLLLKAIPSWDNDIIRKEIERINFKTKEYPWVVQLIQYIFKMNILLNGLDPSESMKKDIDMSLFIHTIYIECARQFWMDPFLFYHEYSSLEQKKNYCEIMKVISCCIENAIRRLLPLATIFEKFLGEQTFNGKSLDLFEQYNMPLILDIPIKLELPPVEPEIIEPKVEKDMFGSGNDNNMLGGSGELVIQGGIVNGNEFNNKFGFNNQQNNNVETNENNLNDKILNIINKNSVLSDSNNNNHFTVNNHSNNDNMHGGMMPMQQMQTNMMPMQQMQNNMMPIPMQNNMMPIPMQNNMMPMPQMQMPQMQMPQMQMPQMQMQQMQQMPMPMQQMQATNRHHSDRKSSSTLKRIVHESIRQTQNTATKSNASHNDSDIKNKILKDLDSDTMTYNPEDNAENYQDIFSNSDMKHTVNTNEKMEKKSREKFFNNYLNI